MNFGTERRRLPDALWKLPGAFLGTAFVGFCSVWLPRVSKWLWRTPVMPRTADAVFAILSPSGFDALHWSLFFSAISLSLLLLYGLQNKCRVFAVALLFAPFSLTLLPVAAGCFVVSSSLLCRARFPRFHVFASLLVATTVSALGIHMTLVDNSESFGDDLSNRLHGFALLTGAVVALSLVLLSSMRRRLGSEFQLRAVAFELLVGFVAVVGISLLLCFALATISKPKLKVRLLPTVHGGNFKDEIRLVTWNIRHSTNEEDLANLWEERGESLAAYLVAIKPDIIALQEATISQLWDLDSWMNKEGATAWQWFGNGRDDGVHRGEHVVVMWNSSRWDFVDGETTWLSDSPCVPSAFPNVDREHPRIVTWLLLEETLRKQQLFIVATHFGWGKGFEEKAARRVLRDTALRLQGRVPTVVMGDFNSNSSEPWYQTLTATNDKLRLVDTMKACSSASRCLSANCTDTMLWDGNPSCQDPTKDARIDHIFVSSDTQVKSFRISRALRSDLKQQFLHAFNAGTHRSFSDHFPVITDIVLP